MEIENISNKKLKEIIESLINDKKDIISRNENILKKDFKSLEDISKISEDYETDTLKRIYGNYNRIIV